MWALKSASVALTTDMKIIRKQIYLNIQIEFNQKL